MIDRSDYIFGGYIITREFDRMPWMSEETLPSKILSIANDFYLSACDDTMPNWVTLTDDETLERCIWLGMEVEDSSRMRSWITRRFQDKRMLHPNIVVDLETAAKALSFLASHTFGG